MHVLVVGGTGTIGRHLVPLLIARGARVSVLTRSQTKSTAVAGPARGEVGDLNRSYTLHGAFDAVDAMVLVTAHSITETGQGLAAVNAAIASRVRRIVFLSAAAPAGAMRIPHVASKAPIEHALITARLEYAIVRAHNFFQNDLCVEEEIASGLYPLPIGASGISRIDARDVADAIANATLDRGHERRLYTLGSREVFTGESIAGVYSRVMRRNVRYGGDNTEAWERGPGAPLPKWQRDDLRIMFRFYQEQGMRMELADVIEQERVIGHEPRRFDDFASGAFRDWRAALNAAEKIC
jgi:uncharacterized protein YbjT (DUF2867 family)